MVLAIKNTNIHRYTALYKFSFLRNFTCEFPVVNEKNYTFCRFVYPCRGYNDFSQSNAVRRFRLHKVHIFLISIARRDDLALSVCRLSVSFYANQSLCFKAIGLKLSQKSSFFCGRNQPGRTSISYSLESSVHTMLPRGQPARL